MRISEREAAFCSALDLAPVDSLSEIAKRADVRSTQARYMLSKFTRVGLLYQRLRVDFFKLGILDTGIFFSLNQVTRAQRSAFERALISDKRVAWMGSLAGQYQYGLTVFTKTLAEFGVFMNDLGQIAKGALAKRVLAPRLSFTQISRAYLGDTARRSIELATSPDSIDVDDFDLKLLAAGAKGSFESIRALSRSLGAPYATVERRFARLVDQGIIRGVFFELEPRLLGVSGYRVHLALRSVSAELRKQIERYCMREPRVTFLTHAIGSWDYEAGVEAQEMKEVVRVTAELSELCGPALSGMDVFGEVNDMKWSFFPS